MKAKKAIGHLDKRSHRTRCQACAKRKIKCNGGPPCDYCIKLKQHCSPQTPIRKDSSVFVICPPNESALSFIPVHITDDVITQYKTRFNSFTKTCQLSSQFSDTLIMLEPLMNDAPYLQHIVVAVGALDTSRHSSARRRSSDEIPQVVAFKNYQKSLKGLNARLSDGKPYNGLDVLWGTFLLGLFELLSDPSGDRWATHMLYGSGRLLQLGGLQTQTSRLQTSFLEAFKTLEVNRAIIYGEDTFLADSDWFARAFISETPEPCLALNQILRLMTYTASFSKRFFRQIQEITLENRTRDDPTIKALGLEGIMLQLNITSWYQEYLTEIVAKDSLDDYSTLSVAYYHTLVLFLCRNYTYYPYWTSHDAPSLTETERYEHIDQVLVLLENLCKDSVVCGILFLFPLRVTGSLVEDSSRKARILKILNTIYSKGFLVAQRIILDLQELWNFKSL